MASDTGAPRACARARPHPLREHCEAPEETQEIHKERNDGPRPRQLRAHSSVRPHMRATRTRARCRLAQSARRRCSTPTPFRPTPQPTRRRCCSAAAAPPARVMRSARASSATTRGGLPPPDPVQEHEYCRHEVTDRDHEPRRHERREHPSQKRPGHVTGSIRKRICEWARVHLSGACAFQLLRSGQHAGRNPNCRACMIQGAIESPIAQCCARFSLQLNSWVGSSGHSPCEILWNSWRRTC